MVRNLNSTYNKLFKCGTAKVWLGFATLHILAKHYQPLNRALVTPPSSLKKYYCSWSFCENRVAVVRVAANFFISRLLAFSLSASPWSVTVSCSVGHRARLSGVSVARSGSGV